MKRAYSCIVSSFYATSEGLTFLIQGTYRELRFSLSFPLNAVSGRVTPLPCVSSVWRLPPVCGFVPSASGDRGGSVFPLDRSPPWWPPRSIPSHPRPPLAIDPPPTHPPTPSLGADSLHPWTASHPLSTRSPKTKYKTDLSKTTVIFQSPSFALNFLFYCVQDFYYFFFFIFFFIFFYFCFCSRFYE